MSESETLNAVKRAGSRVVYHMLRAGVESLKAVEALVDELGKVGKPQDDGTGDVQPESGGRVRIELD
jgi:hypothetical protein